ncbi:LLM class flavin-dependent oxidoreductase [Aminobacter anthyllidis]|uniref:LLM class flavin-dependent oxidoreductase n=1 Tax=Aminobacter anthyllidis TaxID=1035067 RepID=UPI0024542714|nr:LLM class flavin-dependent oxidoreductase [Aminobacter anthyllidis]MDH4988851.1 LLM class flavin-dependent oxidoreductase [Aminobacter anthyllidis]
MQIDFTHCPGGVADKDELHSSFFSDTAVAVQRLRQLERAGFSRVLIDDMGGLLANMDLASLALRSTQSIGVLVSHWPGIVAPVVAARQFAAFDQIGSGRLALRVPPSRDLRETNDDSGLVATLGRTDEYLMLLKRLWSNAQPFDHEGLFYRIHGGFVPMKAVDGAAIPLQLGGLSGTALKIAGRHADRFELPVGDFDDTLRLIGRVRVAAEPFGRAGRIRFSLPVHVGAGGQQAWQLAGAPEHMVSALAGFVELGVSDFIVHGLDGAEAVEAFGRQVIPSLRKAFRRHEPTPTQQRKRPVVLRRVV